MMEVARNMALEALSLTEDTILCGPCRFAKVTTNGHSLTVSTQAHHGITIDSSKDPVAWGTNVHFTVPVFPQNATHTMEVLAADADAQALYAKVAEKVGPDGVAMWHWLVDYIVANPLSDTEAAKNAWAAWSAANENAVYYNQALIFLQKTFGTWANLKTQILAKGAAAWKGEPVPTGEVIS